MQPLDPITVSVVVACSPARAWEAFTNPDAVMQWNFASHDWHCPAARNALHAGGGFCYRMEAKDGSMGFDYEGTFIELAPPKHLRLALGPDREVLVEFKETAQGTEVSQTFTPESTFPPEQQRAGWQAIMDNYRQYLAGNPAIET
jgi:uncharacterized protein YndB with AHSA1/START domain